MVSPLPLTPCSNYALSIALSSSSTSTSSTSVKNTNHTLPKLRVSMQSSPRQIIKGKQAEQRYPKAMYRNHRCKVVNKKEKDRPASSDPNPPLHSRKPSDQQHFKKGSLDNHAPTLNYQSSTSNFSIGYCAFIFTITFCSSLNLTTSTADNTPSPVDHNTSHSSPHPGSSSSSHPDSVSAERRMAVAVSAAA